jgi:putative transposase
LIEPEHEISVARQCGLLEVARSSYYYENADESALNLDLMRLMRRTVPENAFLWITADDGSLEKERVSHQS